MKHADLLGEVSECVCGYPSVKQLTDLLTQLFTIPLEARQKCKLSELVSSQRPNVVSVQDVEEGVDEGRLCDAMTLPGFKAFGLLPPDVCCSLLNASLPEVGVRGEVSCYALPEVRAFHREADRQLP